MARPSAGKLIVTGCILIERRPSGKIRTGTARTLVSGHRDQEAPMVHITWCRREPTTAAARRTARGQHAKRLGG
ncbi:MAG: hypothetical protein BJ554DRAFT_170 [Olpidium bornovanus]|uniref:Uncharacterized protein n=1 Tax=Olpidium bornovanus TaxID=278681 RepID=A0A8H8DIU2_9FUNG|nr:MAG: hypothetical protein BJ554DRAFT_170 [Olpidium bornovanus]